MLKLTAAFDTRPSSHRFFGLRPIAGSDRGERGSNLIAETAVTFVLTSGGHNAGIVSEPGHKGRHYRISHQAPGARYVDPKAWYAQTNIEEGSWWPAWLSWLDEQSPVSTAPPALGAPGKGYRPLEDAPGRYVLER
ncbi:MAG: hypothetical protein WBX25_29045 [Rhodomicrobium sp.]